MFHQTLLSSSSSSSSSSSPSPSTFSLSSLFLRPPSACFPLALGALQQPSPFLPFVHPNFAQVQRGMMTEEAMRGGFKPESALYQQQQRNRGEGGGWSAEKETLSGDGFSVDDLLNLGDYAENDEEAEVVAEVDTKAEAAEAEHLGSGDPNSFSPSSSGSAVSCQPSPPLLAPLSNITLATPDAEELEWLSFITDDTISEFPDCPGVVHFPAPPPKSGKETEALPVAAQGAFSLSQDARSLSTEALAPVKAKRTMRSRCATLSIARWSMSCPIPFADSASSTTTSTTTSCSASSPIESSLSDSSDACLIYDHQPLAAGDESFLLYDVPPLPKRQAPKKRGRKPKQPAAAASSSGERRCTHCGAQKTPQWRAGPLGAKTLCNACGVRFKSGRLLPEYRPACSPTFMSSIHSNSHRKVLEMRRKKEAEVVLSAGAAPVFS